MRPRPEKRLVEDFTFGNDFIRRSYESRMVKHPVSVWLTEICGPGVYIDFGFQCPGKWSYQTVSKAEENPNGQGVGLSFYNKFVIHDPEILSQAILKFGGTPYLILVAE